MFNICDIIKIYRISWYNLYYVKLEVIMIYSNVSASDVLMSRNLDRSLDKKTVCLRIPVNVDEDFKKLAGALNVPAPDLYNFVLKYGISNCRAIKEID